MYQKRTHVGDLNIAGIDFSKPRRLFIDMDGTLCEWKKIKLDLTQEEALDKDLVWERVQEVLLSPDYFKNLAPQMNVVKAVRFLAKEGLVDCHILSCVMENTPVSTPQADKGAWLDRFLPEIDDSKRIFVPNGENKSSYVPCGASQEDFLLDDYTKNLREWNGTGIKLLNDVNNSNNTWKGSKISYSAPYMEIAEKILRVMYCNELVVDKKETLEGEYGGVL